MVEVLALGFLCHWLRQFVPRMVTDRMDTDSLVPSVTLVLHSKVALGRDSLAQPQLSGLRDVGWGRYL